LGFGCSSSSALILLLTAASVSAQSTAAWTSKGLELAAQGRLDEALAYFDHALGINPKFIPALRAGAQSAYQRKDPRADRYLQRLLAIEPKDSTAHAMAAVIAFERKDCQGASTHFDKAGAVAANDPVAASMHAKCRDILAVAQNEQAYVDRALLWTRRLNWSQARDVTTEGLKQIPASARLHSIRGVARVQLGDFEGAISDFDAADRLAPERRLGAAAQALMLSEQAQPEEAAALLRSALEKQPGDPVLSYLLADVLARAGKIVEAVPLLESSIRARPEFAAAYALVGKLYRMQGEIKQAIRELETAIRLDPENRQAAQQLILALRQDGRPQDAAQVTARLRAQLQRK
jgi:superkiller protein 3